MHSHLLQGANLIPHGTIWTDLLTHDEAPGISDYGCLLQVARAGSRLLNSAGSPGVQYLFAPWDLYILFIKFIWEI